MSLGCGCRFQCRCEQRFKVITDDNFEKTLVQSLTPTVDALRDIAVRLGARQYQVSLVWTRWSGGDRGEGNEEVVKVVRLLPTPMVREVDTLQARVLSIGRHEEGDLHVTEISARYSEDFLLGRNPALFPGDTVPKDMTFFWEINFPHEGSPGVRRRFFPSSAPSKEPTRFQWTVYLARQAGDRTRRGDPE